MAKKTKQSPGALIDQRRLDIAEALKICREKEAALTRAGVQIGTAHYKSDRPNIMFIWEPTKDGKRKYVHVGTKAVNQERKLAEIERWRQREGLRHAIRDLEQEIASLDWAIESTASKVSAVLEYAGLIVDKHT